MTDLSLAEKVEGLDGPCRETDWLVAEAVGLVPEHRVTDGGASWDWTRKPGRWWLIRVDEHGQAKTWSPWNYTDSIEAVVALIEKELPGARLEVVVGHDFSSARIVSDWGVRKRVLAQTIERADHHAAICALAALLRAKEADHG